MFDAIPRLRFVNFFFHYLPRLGIQGIPLFGNRTFCFVDTQYSARITLSTICSSVAFYSFSILGLSKALRLVCPHLALLRISRRVCSNAEKDFNLIKNTEIQRFSEILSATSLLFTILLQFYLHSVQRNFFVP